MGLIVSSPSLSPLVTFCSRNKEIPPCACVCALRQMSEALPQSAAPRHEVEHLYTDSLIHTHKDLHIYTDVVDCLVLGLQ